MVTIPGWLSFARALASRAKRSANEASSANEGGKDFQGDHTVEPGLADLIDRAHPALADQAEHLELREDPRQFRDRRRHETAPLAIGEGIRGRTLAQQVRGAKPAER